jgi:hypothetical protein
VMYESFINEMFTFWQIRIFECGECGQPWAPPSTPLSCRGDGRNPTETGRIMSLMTVFFDATPSIWIELEGIQSSPQLSARGLSSFFVRLFI